MTNAEANTILKEFKAKFPKPDPQKIFKIPNGYVVVAFLVKDDIADPYYYVSEDFKEIVHFNMAKLPVLLKAFKEGAIWEK